MEAEICQALLYTFTSIALGQLTDEFRPSQAIVSHAVFVAANSLSEGGSEGMAANREGADALSCVSHCLDCRKLSAEKCTSRFEEIASLAATPLGQQGYA